MLAEAISPAEWTVMRAVWAHGPMTGRQIEEVVTQATDWKLGTVKSLRHRLVKKGALDQDKSQRPCLYVATLPEDQAGVEVLTHELAQVCRSQRGQVLGQVLEETVISQEDLRELQALIEAKLQTAPQVVPCDCPPGLCRCQVTRQEDQ